MRIAGNEFTPHVHSRWVDRSRLKIRAFPRERYLGSNRSLINNKSNQRKMTEHWRINQKSMQQPGRIWKASTSTMDIDEKWSTWQVEVIVDGNITCKYNQWAACVHSAESKNMTKTCHCPTDLFKAYFWKCVYKKKSKWHSHTRIAANQSRQKWSVDAVKSHDLQFVEENTKKSGGSWVLEESTDPGRGYEWDNGPWLEGMNLGKGHIPWKRAWILEEGIAFSFFSKEFNSQWKGYIARFKEWIKIK